MDEIRRQPPVLLIALPLIAALLAGVLVYALTGSRAVVAEQERDRALLRIEALEAEVTMLSQQQDEETVVEVPDTPGDSTSDATDDAVATPDGRYFCYVTEVVNEDGTTVMTVDFAELLTGDEAAAAAAAAGEESPPPNDYWITNVNPQLRTFPVQTGTNVRLVTTPSGVNPEGYTVTLGQWEDFFAGMSPGMERVRETPYWIEVESGTVTAIEEQYLP